MIEDARIASRFGTQDKPPCANCGTRTFLTRRSPAAKQALKYERQTFTCPGCQREFDRIVDADGKVIRGAAIQWSSTQLIRYR